MKRRIKSKFGLTGGKPLMLVGSHWTPGGILRAFGGGILDALTPLAGECEIAQISHPNLWEDLPYDTWHPTNRWPSQKEFSSAWICAAPDARQNAGIVKVTDDLESTDLLMAADLYIGDYSSNVIEFSNFDWPILYYGARERFFDSKIYDLYAGASTPFHSADYIARLARLALGNPEINQAGRQRLRRHFNYNIGGATKAVVEAISGLS